MTNMLGIDLSQNQGTINYAKTRAAVSWCYIRVYRSNGAIDTMWRTHYDGMNGKLRAPYLFMRDPKIVSVAAQVATFWAVAKTVTWELPIVLDCEYSGVTAAAIGSMISEVRKQTGQQVVYVYIGRADWQKYCNPIIWATDVNIRIIGARYYANNFDNAFVNFGLTHTNLDVVQYWDKGTIAGITGNVDLNNAKTLRLAATTSNTSKETEMAALQDNDPDWLAVASFTDSLRDMTGTLTWDNTPANIKGHENKLVTALNKILANQTTLLGLVNQDIQLDTAQKDQLVAVVAAIAKIQTTAGTNAVSLSDEDKSQLVSDFVAKLETALPGWHFTITTDS